MKGIESKVFCFYQATNGIKKYLAVDILGFPFYTHALLLMYLMTCVLIEMLSQNIDYFKSKNWFLRLGKRQTKDKRISKLYNKPSLLQRRDY
jgi:hypothetical protein